jgi:hypothetical protein
MRVKDWNVCRDLVSRERLERVSGSGVQYTSYVPTVLAIVNSYESVAVVLPSEYANGPRSSACITYSAEKKEHFQCFFFLVLCVVAREYDLRVQYASVFISAQVFGLDAASLVDSTRFRSNLCEAVFRSQIRRPDSVTVATVFLSKHCSNFCFLVQKNCPKID